MVLSADGRRLYVTNAPANCLEIYAVEGDSLRLASSVAVGLEPVAIAERNANEVWVVNHLSDSVSVVRLDGTPRVLRTLQVGDEPRDIVFAGPNRDRAFITAAFRGQNRPGMTFAAQITSGSGRADVWVFDAAALSDGPVAKLGHPALQVPITLHSTWLESTRSTRPDYRVDVASELLDRAETWRFDPEVLSVLRNDVLPAYDAIVG